ncbi:MAG: hypothetical protein ACD_46C00682G0005 [uncultured bacterium]|nr:MAG: hypothetical protein ACD_46C00682G0005 [uncultured bacterium]
MFSYKVNNISPFLEKEDEETIIEFIESNRIQDAWYLANKKIFNENNNFLVRVIQDGKWNSRWITFLENAYAIDPQSIKIIYPVFNMVGYSDVITDLFLFLMKKPVAWYDYFDQMIFDNHTKELFILASLKSDFAKQIITEELQKAYDHFDAKQFQFFYTLSPSLSKSLNLNSEKIQLLMSVEKQNQDKFKDFMMQFTRGFGHINEEGVLLTCAQISDRKKYSFNPTVLNDDNFDKYLRLLSDMPYPLRERFYIKSIHAICGDIWIDRDGCVSVLLIDSLGFEKSGYFREYGEKIGKQFSNAKIYVSYNKKQYSDMGCSVFAIDDLVHLYTMEKYLLNEFKPHPAPLHAYINKTAEELDESKTHHGITIHACALPLRLQLNTQFRRVKSEVIPAYSENETKLFVNKKNETALQAIEKHIERDEYTNEKNKRLEHKLDRLAERNANFMAKGNFESKMLLFGLEAKKHELKMHDKHIQLTSKRK